MSPKTLRHLGGTKTDYYDIKDYENDTNVRSLAKKIL